MKIDLFNFNELNFKMIETMIRKAPIAMIMTEQVITLKKDDHLEKAEDIFKKYNIRHIPIVENKAVIGMLSNTDVLRQNFKDNEILDESDDLFIHSLFTIEQVMRKKLISVSSSNSIKDVAEIFATKEYHALPVVENNELVGIVTTTDLIRHLINQI